MAGFETIHWINQEVKSVLDEYQTDSQDFIGGEETGDAEPLHNSTEKEDFIWGDYRKLAEILVIMLGGKLPGDKPMVW